MKKLSLSIITIFALILCFSISNATDVPPECGAGASPDLSYAGNWDVHVGGCWTPPEPRTCVVCDYTLEPT